MKPGKDPVVVLVFIALAVVFYFYNVHTEKKTEDASYRVAEVLDGDTIVIDDGKGTLVRYLGIDTPEAAHQDSPGDPYSAEAGELNRKLVGGKTVRLEFDSEKYDVYGRLLAYVYADGVSVSQELLRQGLATTLFIEPNGKYKDSFNKASEEARRERRGMWGDLDTIDVPAGNGAFVVDIDKASLYEGKRVVVRGRITGARESGKAVVLSIDGKFDVVIFRDALDNFRFFGIDPASYYMEKEVEVTGRVKMYKGTPGVHVNHPIHIRRTG